MKFLFLWANCRRCEYQFNVSTTTYRDGVRESSTSNGRYRAVSAASDVTMSTVSLGGGSVYDPCGSVYDPCASVSRVAPGGGTQSTSHGAT